MKKTNPKILAIFFCAVFLSASQALASASVSRPAEDRSLAPDFSLTTVAGKNVSLKDFKGRNVMIFFFATWCPSCRDKFPELIKNAPAYVQEGVELLVIDAGESPSKVAAFVQKQGVPFDILLDKDMKVAQDYEVVGVPAFVLISKQGQVLYADYDLPDDYRQIYNRSS